MQFDECNTDFIQEQKLGRKDAKQFQSILCCKLEFGGGGAFYEELKSMSKMSIHKYY